jgi:hypothetical protein
MRKKSSINRPGNDRNNGNQAILILCPKCQDDLSLTIEATFLMRKVRKMKCCIDRITPVSDSELSAAELRFKYSVTPQQIEQAKLCLKQFQEDLDNGVISQRSVSYDSPTRKQGNLDNSTITKNISIQSTSVSNNYQICPLLSTQLMKMINLDIFRGMKDMLSNAEQIFISDLITSGDVDKLVQGTQIVNELKRIHWSDDDDQSNSNKLGKSKLVDEEKCILQMSMSTQEQKQLHEIQKYLELFPLPRMPKYITLQANFDVYAKHSKVLKFRDDGWDGSVSDAFARVYTMSDSVEELQSVINIDEEEDGFVNQSVSTRKPTRQNRVLIYAARKQAACVCDVGDIVTHFDDNDFLGTASELREIINRLFLSGNKLFSLVLNAEQSTADYLKNLALELRKVQET